MAVSLRKKISPEKFNNNKFSNLNIYWNDKNIGVK